MIVAMVFLPWRRAGCYRIECAGQLGVARSRLIDLATTNWLHDRSLLNCADLTSCCLLLSNTPPLA
ncbi:uncharacterized protein M421DRAFT_425149 [Didymella exigua CBS 183.55]|uniref:Uncharacterized protein n=1 Tax=Didymella exigua CBS 183.55 TaxID=1150837 RepID=A0A6A5RE54_9PLEO|nr:uncharacterized protein M421DRAFT_425149 [Didymella exigua CBS 183.55]KAF1923987.1 hypothetical protein M421DRAFT_425149 [Didymella exigua CBS 183.55]